MDSSRPLCGHLLTHIDPAIEQLLGEKLNIQFSGISQMSAEDYMQFGQLGLDAKWLLDNIGKIEEIFGQVIDSQVKWNKAVAALTKKGFSAIEGFDKNAVDAVISLRRRESKIGEGNDRIANSEGFFSQIRANNNELDRIRLSAKLCESFATLKAAKQQALSEPEVQAAMAAWKASLGSAAKQAKLGLTYGLATPSHPSLGGELVDRVGGSQYSQSQFVSYSQLKQLGSGIGKSVNFFGKAMGNIGNGFKKISNFFRGK